MESVDIFRGMLRRDRASYGSSTEGRRSVGFARKAISRCEYPSPPPRLDVLIDTICQQQSAMVHTDSINTEASENRPIPVEVHQDTPVPANKRKATAASLEDEPAKRPKQNPPDAEVPDSAASRYSMSLTTIERD